MWWYLAYFVFGLALTFALRPKIQGNKLQPGEFEVPTAKIGKDIAVIFGTCDITDPNIVWYGDTKAVAIKKKGGKK